MLTLSFELILPKTHPTPVKRTAPITNKSYKYTGANSDESEASVPPLTILAPQNYIFLSSYRIKGLFKG